MKIVLIASIRGKSGNEDVYETIVRVMKNSGADVVSDHVMRHSQSELDTWTSDQKVAFHKKLFDEIRKADVVVGEISAQSVSVGYLISLAVDIGKPTILLYKGNNDPNLMSTLVATDKLQYLKYSSPADIEKQLPGYIQYATERVDVRFNFFISPQIGTYLDWVSKKRRIPRAVYLRKLIEEDMENNTEFEQNVG